MHAIYTYFINVGGQLDKNSFNEMSPLHIEVVRESPTDTLFSAHTDQSGLIGLIRHLHRQGFELLSVNKMQ